MTQLATPKQLHSLWSFCQRFGSDNVPSEQWKTFNIGFEDAKCILEWKDALVGKKDMRHVADISHFINRYIPGFFVSIEKIEGNEKKASEPTKHVSTPVIEDDSVESLLKKLQEKLTPTVIVEESSKPKVFEVSAGYVKPPIFDKVCRYVKAGVNVVLTGPAGTGKSRMFEEIAKTLELSFFTTSFSGGVRYNQVIGGTGLKNGETDWQPSPLLMAVQEPGIVFLDEVFSAEPDIMLGLNSLLKYNTRNIMTPIGEIKVHPECRLVAAANTTGRQVSRQYTGAQKSDDSLLDRFVSLETSYDIETDKALLESLPSEVKAYFISKLETLRRECKANNIPFDASTRRLLTACKLFCEAEATKEEAFEDALLGGLSATEKAKLSI